MLTKKANVVRYATKESNDTDRQDLDTNAAAAAVVMSSATAAAAAPSLHNQETCQP